MPRPTHADELQPPHAAVLGPRDRQTFGERVVLGGVGRHGGGERIDDQQPQLDFVIRPGMVWMRAWALESGLDTVYFWFRRVWVS